MGTLIDELQKKQAEARMSNSEFASNIGVTDVFWGMIRKGQRELGKHTLGLVCVRYPELQLHVIDYLRRSCQGGASS